MIDEREELLQMIERQQVLNISSKDLLEQANSEIERLTSENLDYYEQINLLKHKNDDLKTELDDMVVQQGHWVIEKKELNFKIEIWKDELNQMRQREKRSSEMEKEIEECKKKLLDKDSQINELGETVKTLNSRISLLEETNSNQLKRIEEQDALIAPFKEQLESYELEMKNLKSAKDYMENEAKDLGQRYAEILGHQNHRQKIKYMVNLKSKNEELAKPTVIKRRNVLGSTSKLKFPNLKLSDKELLHEKIVECNNKDTFIKEITEQLEDLKNKIFDVQREKEAVSRQKTKYESEISDWREMHNVEINHLCKKYKTEIYDLNETISRIETDLELLERTNKLLNEEMETVQSNNEQEISKYKIEISAKNIVIAQMQENLEKMQEHKRNIEEKHKLEIEGIRDKHLAELQSIEIKMLNSIHDMQMALDEQKLQSQLKVKELENAFEKEIKSLKHSFHEEKEQINTQNINRISQLEEKMNDIKLISEIQAVEKCSELENYWKTQLENKEKESSAILKECQAISEYNIIQSEVEKNKYKSQFEENKKKYDVLERKYDDVYLKYRKLQAGYSDVQNKLYRLMKEMREKDVLKNQMNQLLLEKQTYQTTISRSQETIDILTNRLKESDHDVEQLKNEISNNEKKLVEFEHKINLMIEEMKGIQSYNETLEMNNELYLKVAQEEINTLKKDLWLKVDENKLISEKNDLLHKEKVKKMIDEREELLQMIERQQVLNISSKDLLEQANSEIERLTSENLDYYEQINLLKHKNDDLKTELDDMVVQQGHWVIEKKELNFKIEIWKDELNQMRQREKRSSEMEKEIEECKKKLLDKDSQINELGETVKTLNSRISLLEETNSNQLKRIEEQDALIAPFKEQLESYELEMKNLKSAKDYMENEAKDLGQRYAEILGHQNHRQKIKYMVNLKSKNEELAKTNLDLESKLRIQEKKLEKLKKENADLKRNKKIALFEDKENIGSPNRSFKCDSPGPLKNLN